MTLWELGALMEVAAELNRQIRIAQANWPSGEDLHGAEDEIRRLIGKLGELA